MEHGRRLADPHRLPDTLDDLYVLDQVFLELEVLK